MNVRGICLYIFSVLFLWERYVDLLYISAWAFDVARSGELGNAKALSSGMSNKYRLSRFFFLYAHYSSNIMNRPVRESAGK